VKARMAAVVVVAFLVGAFSMMLAAGQAKPTVRGLKQRVVALESRVATLETELADQATNVSDVQAQLVRQASDMQELQAKTINLDANGAYQGQVGGGQVTAPAECADGSAAVWRLAALGC
jgi:hypothetical protein